MRASFFIPFPPVFSLLDSAHKDRGPKKKPGANPHNAIRSGLPLPSVARHRVFQQVFWLSDPLKGRGLPLGVDPESDRSGSPDLCVPSSPITAAGPPRICTVFRDAERLYVVEKPFPIKLACCQEGAEPAPKTLRPDKKPLCPAEGDSFCKRRTRLFLSRRDDGMGDSGIVEKTHHKKSGGNAPALCREPHKGLTIRFPISVSLRSAWVERPPLWEFRCAAPRPCRPPRPLPPSLPQAA